MIKCTIVIPTYNRPAYLRRILDYYSQYGEDFSIIVADSGSEKNKKLNKETVSSVSSLDIKYLDNYSSTITPFHKLANAVSCVDAKYCVFCADDDFVTPDGIKQSVDFLENNPDFTVAHGYYILFGLEEGERKKGRFGWGAPGYSHKSIAFSDPEARLNHHLANYLMPTVYAVHRTDFLKVVLPETVKFTNDYPFGELLPSMLTLIYGKMKCLDVLYAAREVIPTSASRTQKTLTDFMRDGTYNEKYAKFRDCLSTHLSKQSRSGVEESKKVVDDAMSAYMARSMKKHSSRDGKHILVSKISAILGLLNLPDRVDNRVRKLLTGLYRRLFLPGHVRDFPITMEISPSSKYYDDLDKIRLHVLSYSKRNTE